LRRNYPSRESAPRSARCLPEKTELNAFCSLSKRQAALYQRAVDELAAAVRPAEGLQRRGIVLAFLMRLKQICNHPSQATGDGIYEPKLSGKFDRLRELCEELAERQQRVLVFTQFREITSPLAEFLASVLARVAQQSMCDIISPYFAPAGILPGVHMMPGVRNPPA
jgi:hypothetical protein